jgi:ferredoxin-NADP reductase/Na+-translocating ferredoxin:NAD+ oxidoreductase RnfD subunit
MIHRFFQWSLIQVIAAYLDRTGMYRVVTHALVTLTIVALGLGFVGVIPYAGSEQLLSLVLVLVVALGGNWLGQRLLRVHVNYESAVITALIVHFLVLPPRLMVLSDWWPTIFVTALAIASKFFFVYRKQHLANPAATGAVLVSLGYAFIPGLGSYESLWWIGTPELFIPTVIAGALVVSKVRKWVPVIALLGVGFAVFVFEGWRYSGDIVGEMRVFWLSAPYVFLAAFMLTEPFTMPPRRRLQAVYGGVVGLLATTVVFSPFFKMTPELALVIGNLIFFQATVRQKLFFTFSERRTLADRTYEFVFKKPAGFVFAAGQYLEWMLPHAATDSRGIRRYFTIASSPTEPDVRLSMRVPEQHSSFKEALLRLAPLEVVIASQLAGDFVLPADHTQPIAFIAGGIGVTPFRSHLAYLADAKRPQDVVLYYCNNTESEIAYRDEFSYIARVIPLRVVQVLAKEERGSPEYEHGLLTVDIIARRTPDYRDRTWYLSGPPGMVNAYDKLLREMGVKGTKIVKDFFPGLA